MAAEDYAEPVLLGPGASDYERYLRTDELLALQPDPATAAHRIGDEVIGTQGTPVELLGGLIKQKFFPELWDARNRLTALANRE